MRFAGALFALAIVLTGVDADLVAFSGFNCEGDEGDNVQCPKYCYEFGNRNSFAVLVAGPIVVSLYTDTSCSSEVGQITNPGNGACSNVNVGTVMNVQSFTCNPDNTSTATTIVQSPVISNPVTTIFVIEPSSTTSSTAGSTSTAKSSASSNKKFLHWIQTGALLGLAAAESSPQEFQVFSAVASS